MRRREKGEKSKGRKRCRLAMAPRDTGAGSPAVAGPVGCCRREGGVRCEGSERARRAAGYALTRPGGQVKCPCMQSALLTKETMGASSL